MSTFPLKEISGQALTMEQSSYLDGFFNGLKNRGFSFEDTEPNPVSKVAPSETERTLEERIKHELHPLDSYSTLLEFAAGNQPPDKENLFRFKWHGLFYLAPGKEAYMARLRIPGGQLRSFQLREIARISQELTSGYIQITTRANLQLRLIEPRHTPEFLHRIQSVGLHTKGAGADNVRNLTCDPTSGLHAEELIDPLPMVHQLAHVLLNNREFSNLPRKFNIAFNGGGPISSVEDTNDVGFTAVRVCPKSESGSARAGSVLTDQLAAGVYYRVALGGATGHKCFGRDLNVLIAPADALKTTVALLKVYIAHGDRSDRKRARLKHLLETWSLDRYLDETEKLLGFRLLRIPTDAVPAGQTQVPTPTSTPTTDVAHTHLGVHSQKHPGLFYIGASVPVGQLTAKQLTRLAELADLYGSGEIRLTVWQNFIIPNVPEQFVETVTRALSKMGMPAKASNVRGGFVACTGNSYCKFASSNTKGHAIELMDYLERRVKLDVPINIHLTGCPNSCAQHYMGDIGLLGTKVKLQGESREGYHVFVGGGFGQKQALGRMVFQGLSFDELKPTLEKMLLAFIKHREIGEPFQTFTTRRDIGNLQEMFTQE